MAGEKERKWRVTVARGLDDLPTYREMVKATREQVSREYLALLMKACDGNVTRAAKQAGLRRESLHRLLRRYGIAAEAEPH